MNEQHLDNNPNLLRERKSRHEPIHQCLNLIKSIAPDYRNIWEDLMRLLIDHEYDTTGYSLDISQIIVMLRLCLDYDIEEVAKLNGINYGSFIKTLDNVIAAFYFLISDENVFPKYLLNKESLNDLSIFERHLKQKKRVENIVRNKDIRSIVNRCIPLSDLVKELVDRGTIRPFLKSINLTYENSVNVDNSFYRFIVSGDLRGGNLTLLRRVLYAKWLCRDIKINNLYDHELTIIYGNIGKWAMDQEVTKENAHIRETSLFFKYLFLKEFNEGFLDLNREDEEIKELFPIRKMMKNRRFSSNRIFIPINRYSESVQLRFTRLFIVKNGVAIIPIDWDKYYDNGPMPSQFEDYIKKFVIEKDRLSTIEDISRTLMMSPSSMRKVYDRSLKLIDLILSSNYFFQHTGRLSEQLKESMIEKAYNSYKVTIQSIHTES
ncbi:MAG: hypothetical protein ABI721_02785 [Candidatus Dojkabacteria bacterium]